MDLQQLVLEMKQVALANKLNLATIAKDLAKAVSGVSAQKRCEEIDGHNMVLQLTYNALPNFGGCWHLSFSIEGHKPMPPELVEKLRKAFLGDEPPLLEIPSMWGPVCRQFMQKAE